MFKDLFLTKKELKDLPIRDLTKEVNYYDDILKCNLTTTDRVKIVNYLKLVKKEMRKKFDHLKVLTVYSF